MPTAVPYPPRSGPPFPDGEGNGCGAQRHLKKGGEAATTSLKAGMSGRGLGIGFVYSVILLS